MREPLAIVGLGGVFPGAADVEALWSRVVTATPAPMTSQEQRWGASRASYLGAPGELDRAYMDQAFTVPIEACTMGESLVDPQVRAGRHAVRVALAESGLDPADVALVAATSWAAPSYFEHDAARLLPSLTPSAPPYAADAQLAAIGAGLGGPCLAVDTACASSLYAVDVAAGLIEQGRARAVIVLGLNVLLPPFLYIGFSRLGALSPASRILPFSADASGIVPGECAAAIVVEPLDRARGEGRRVQAVIRAIGLAADGAERSIFAPGARGQQLAYARAWEGLDPADIDYVEAHGTATSIGDQTEIETLEAFFGPHRRGAKLPIGSIKGLVGHTLAAAGIASIAKVVLSLRHQTLPPHLEVTPHPGLASTCLALPTVATPWSATPGRPRRAAVSGFGFGGANAHVVLEEDAPARRAAMPVARATIAIVDAEAVLDLPASMAIDAAGLRAGPKLLQRVDPLQLLVTHLVREVLSRNPQPSERTGVVMTSNLGGATCLRLSRKYLRQLHGMPADAADPELSIEAIGSSLPTMCSGTPSFHFDLRAFHQTLSGDAGTFVTTLSLAQHWLEGRCDALVLGAAHLRVSPIDPETREGAAVFLLKSAERARTDGDRVLALLSDAEPGVHVDRREVIDVDAGPLAEATGIDALMGALAGEGRRVAIDVRSKGRVVSTLLVEKQHSLESKVRTPRIPLQLVFREEPKQTVHETHDRVAAVQRWIADTSTAVEAYVRAQAKLASALPPSESVATPVLEDVELAGGSASARVRVDEGHPYFFDHPLDHVPGILLVEAITELASARSASERWVRALDIRFRRFCEKNLPIRIELSRDRGRIVQSGVPVATFSVEVTELTEARTVEHATDPTEIPAVEPSLLHKHRRENVLVGPLEETTRGLVARVRRAPRGHLFDDGRPFLSPLHLLEAARQVVMLAAHGVLGIPLGMPMNLISVRLACDAPAMREGDLRLRLKPSPLRRLDGTLVSDVGVVIEEGGRAIGEASIKAQVVDVDTYRKQRGLHP